ncbi:MAG: trypsin-like peptidase domain-containing protein [Nocardioides sp.]|nr:trypsin-like peptidase domain-containing protein [Nocardioides sp.]
MSNDHPDQAATGDESTARPQHPGTPPPPPGYAAPSWDTPQPTPPAPTAPDRLGRRRFAAGVIAASLLVGGGAGVGGAATWNALSDDAVTGLSGTSTQRARSTSQAVASSASPAASGTVESVAAKVLPSVVKIEVTGQQGSGSGSGIILSRDGQILTNNHVVEVAAQGGSVRVAFNDGTSAPATVVGTDPLTDTALIQAEGVDDLTPASIGTSGDLAVGQPVVAIGSPFGLESTVTSGIVSALDRPVDVGSDGEGNSTTYPAIQTDAAINPGNSGGALTDMAGNVVGINSSIRTAGTSAGAAAGSIGLGFAIPMDEVLPIVEQMANGQTPTHARLGVQVGNVAPGGTGAAVIEGAAISLVNDGSTAADAGIAVGDVITRVDDRIITGADSLVATVRSYRPGDTVTVTFVREGQSNTAELTLDSDADTSTS